MNDNSRSDSMLSDDQRRAIFRQELSLTSEAGANRFSERIPQKFVRGVLVAIIVLGGGGALVERYFGNVGLPSSSTPTAFATPSTIPFLGTTTVPSVITTSQAFIGLKFIGTANVPHFSLTDQHGATITPTTSKGSVTLVTFYNKNCNDICPVIGSELRIALADLGTQGRRAVVDIINTDPFSYGVSAEPLALTSTGLGGEPNVHFLNGSVATLSSVWKSFGIQVSVGATASQVAHNSLLYFVGPKLELSALATPFAHESTTGLFSLSRSDIQKFAQGVELETISLLP